MHCSKSFRQTSSFPPQNFARGRAGAQQAATHSAHAPCARARRSPCMRKMFGGILGDCMPSGCRGPWTWALLQLQPAVLGGLVIHGPWRDHMSGIAPHRNRNPRDQIWRFQCLLCRLPHLHPLQMQQPDPCGRTLQCSRRICSGHVCPSPPEGASCIDSMRSISHRTRLPFLCNDQHHKYAKGISNHTSCWGLIPAR